MKMNAIAVAALAAAGLVHMPNAAAQDVGMVVSGAKELNNAQQVRILGEECRPVSADERSCLTAGLQHYSVGSVGVRLNTTSIAGQRVIDQHLRLGFTLEDVNSTVMTANRSFDPSAMIGLSATWAQNGAYAPGPAIRVSMARQTSVSNFVNNAGFGTPVTLQSSALQIESSTTVPTVVKGATVNWSPYVGYRVTSIDITATAAAIAAVPQLRSSKQDILTAGLRGTTELGDGVGLNFAVGAEHDLNERLAGTGYNDRMRYSANLGLAVRTSDKGHLDFGARFADEAWNKGHVQTLRVAYNHSF